MTTIYGCVSDATLKEATRQLMKNAERWAVSFPEPPPDPDPSWSDEMKEAHRVMRGGLRTIRFRRYPPG